MKKSVLVLIMVIYVASIVVIGFFGVRVGTFNVTQYVDQIELTNEEVVYDPNGVEKYILIQFAPYNEGENNPNFVQLYYKVIPEDATYRNVTFEHAENDKATVNSIGTVVFTGRTTLTIYITSTDGTNVRTKIKVVAY